MYLFTPSKSLTRVCFQKEPRREEAMLNEQKWFLNGETLGRGRRFRREALRRGFLLAFPDSQPMGALPNLFLWPSPCQPLWSVTSLLSVLYLPISCPFQGRIHIRLFLVPGCACLRSAHILLLLIFQVSTQTLHLIGPFPEGPVLLVNHFHVSRVYKLLYCLKPFLRSLDYYHHYEFGTRSVNPCSFTKCLLSIYSVPGIAKAPGVQGKQNRQSPCSHGSGKRQTQTDIKSAGGAVHLRKLHLQKECRKMRFCTKKAPRPLW